MIRRSRRGREDDPNMTLSYMKPLDSESPRVNVCGGLTARPVRDDTVIHDNLALESTTFVKP